MNEQRTIIERRDDGGSNRTEERAGGDEKNIESG
jgi:hypothetical protein